MMGIIVVVFIVLVLIIAASCIRIVPQAQALICLLYTSRCSADPCRAAHPAGRAARGICRRSGAVRR